MQPHIQRNFLFIWVLVLLGMALVLSLTFTGCAGKTVQTTGKATGMISQKEEKPDVPKFASGCSDSDGGIVKETKGIATYDGGKVDDECVGPFLVEYYCENGNVANQNIKCSCSKGVCV